MKTLQKPRDALCPRAESRTAAHSPVEFTLLVAEPSLAQAQLGHAAPREGNGVHGLPGQLPVRPAPIRTKAGAASHGWGKLAAKPAVSVKS